MNDLDGIKERAISALNEAPDKGVLRDLEKRFLGKKGEVLLLLKELKNLPENERKSQGKKIQALKKELEQIFQEKSELFKNQPTNQPTTKNLVDVTMPGKRFERGHAHPLTRVTNEMCEIFSGMGFEVLLGPDAETEYYNFDALNIPKNHPARDMWDTFWLQNGQLLRTHTSPMQARYMEKNQPPFRIVVPGRCYRYEATDATHDMQFYQLEGLMIGRDINLSHLKGVMESFFRKIFKSKELEVRFRPSYFPFTEPSVEVDLRINKKSKWLEIAGAGMVHPQVLKNVKIDPSEWRGFAFGVGIDRVAMLKYKINDIRLFYGSDLRFIKQF